MTHTGSPQHRLAPSGGTTGVITADVQWHDVELALTVARHSYDRWLTAVQDAPSLATMHAYHTHEALHEAARAFTTLIDTFRAEAAALITTPAPDTRPMGATQAPEGFRCPTG
jgi:hypothetical protein